MKGARGRLAIATALMAVLVAACAAPAGGSGSATACPAAAPTAAEAQTILADAGSAVVTTSKGAFTMTLYGDKAPIATANFVSLVRCGFYDGITFHRVIAGFVIQAGDPQTKANHGDFDALGTGGPGYSFAIEKPAAGLSYEKYVVAMANTGQPDSNGSQFFVDLANLNEQLTPTYTIFGKVVSGTDVVDTIGQVPTNGAKGVPLDPVIIQSIRIQPTSGTPSAS